MSPDFHLLYRDIQMANAVYEMDPSRAVALFDGLGASVLGRYCDDGHQAIACTVDGRATLVICGTRVTEGRVIQHICDIISDADVLPHFLHGSKAAVPAGAILGMDKVWEWALALFHPGEAVDVIGHSLGGQRTCLTPLFLPAARIGRMVAFEPPKAGNMEYWAECADALRSLLIVVHERDPWADHAWFGTPWVHQPGPLLWLHDGTWSWEAAWRAGSLLEHWGDHGPDTVVAAIGALAA